MIPTPPPGASTRVRSYALTLGRTRPSVPLLLETLVTALDPGPAGLAAMTPEQRRIYLACAESRSVTEIAAEVELPVGVVRVLVSDLAQQNLVEVHRTVGSGPQADTELLERILHGLHAIAG
ncbi:DUF742 domain-containing protein [Actinorugispora endophytica]|uniref:Uncharacterized protein DUF742 n=1 Tax=Actinorugispora endophytica TaxID=1605990 RepID=A0A4R6V9K1_9ACTN|nr:DUF742 domain-containing protein [Actinorugispora endophytica]TDQ55518.1 uncharacterized protein DUF742 [Actinorugispora endophytica]